MCEAIRRAVENVSYEKLNGTAIKGAFNNIKDFDVYGLKTFTYTPDNHSGSRNVAIYQVRDEKLVRISDWKPAPTIVPVR